MTKAASQLIYRQTSDRLCPQQYTRRDGEAVERSHNLLGHHFGQGTPITLQYFVVVLFRGYYECRLLPYNSTTLKACLL